MQTMTSVVQWKEFIIWYESFDKIDKLILGNYVHTRQQ